MRQPARFRNYYRKTLSRQQRRNRWLLYLALGLLTLAGNRWVASCTKVALPEKPGLLTVAKGSV